MLTHPWSHSRIVGPTLFLSLKYLLILSSLVQLPQCYLLSFTGFLGHVPFSFPSIKWINCSPESMVGNPRFLWRSLNILYLKICAESRAQSLPLWSWDLPDNEGPPRHENVNMISYTYSNWGVGKATLLFHWKP